jgi:hypothetical protein
VARRVANLETLSASGVIGRGFTNDRILPSAKRI